MSARDREHVQAVHGLNCGCVYHRQERAVAAAKVQAATSASAPKLEVALPQREVIRLTDTSRESRVSHTAKKDPTAAVRRARWRKKNPAQHRDQQRAARARRKAGKAVGQ